MSTWEIIKSPGVPVVLFLYGHVMLLGLAFTAGTFYCQVHALRLLHTNTFTVSPLFWYTSVENGGCGMTPIQISAFFSLVGISQASWLLLAFPPLQNKFGTGSVLRACLYAWPFFFAAGPFGNWLLRNDYRTAFWTIGVFLQVSGSGVSMAFSK